MPTENVHTKNQNKNHSTIFALLYKQYSKQVYNYFWYRINHNSDIAYDLTQETFLKALMRFHQYEARGFSYLTYLLTIAHNILVNFWRDHKTCEDIDTQDIPLEIKQALEDAIDVRQLWLYVQNLPLLEKEVILLRYRRELSVDEIAAITEKSKNAIYLLLSRARKRLKNNITDIGELHKFPDITLPKKVKKH